MSWWQTQHVHVIVIVGDRPISAAAVIEMGLFILVMVEGRLWVLG